MVLVVGTLPGAEFVAEQKQAARIGREAAGWESGTTSVLLPLSSALLLVAHQCRGVGREETQGVGSSDGEAAHSSAIRGVRRGPGWNKLLY